MIYYSDSQSQSLNDKIDALESNIKKLKNDLIVEKKKLVSVEEHSVVDNQILTVSDKDTINTNIYESEEMIKKDPLNTVAKFL